MAAIVREPIQVYLTPNERAELEQAARVLGVSRSEALRRGIRALSARAPYSGPLADLVEGGWVTPPKAGPGTPPAAAPIDLLDNLLAELVEDRGDR
jgi:hypothetical protein